MKKVFTILLIWIASATLLTAQVCTGCTQTISGIHSTPIIAGSGDVICITASGVVNASITVNGGISAGVICNMGVINGSITTTSGQINNYGTINASSISHGGSYNNTFRNYNIVNCLGNYTGSGGTTQFFNYGGMKVEGNFSNDAYFYTHCMIKVNGTFYNNDVIAGPNSGCGGFSVLGGATNDGNFGYSSFELLDMCDSTNVGGWTAQNGGVGSSVTYCVCNDFCSTAIGIEENTSQNNVSVFPNPAYENTTIMIHGELQELYDVYIYNNLGKLMRVLPNNHTNQLNIQKQDLSAGIYFYTLVSQQQLVSTGKLVFK